MPFIHIMTIQRSHMPSYVSEVMEKCLCADGACAIKHCPLSVLFWSLAGEATEPPQMSLEHWKTNNLRNQHKYTMQLMLCILEDFILRAI